MLDAAGFVHDDDAVETVVEHRPHDGAAMEQGHALVENPRHQGIVAPHQGCDIGRAQHQRPQHDVQADGQHGLQAGAGADQVGACGNGNPDRLRRHDQRLKREPARTARTRATIQVTAGELRWIMRSCTIDS